MNIGQIQNIEENTYLVYQQYIKEYLLKFMENALKKYKTIFKEKIFEYPLPVLENISFICDKKLQTIKIDNSVNDVWKDVSGEQFYLYMNEFISKNELGFCLYYGYDCDKECCYVGFNTSLGKLYKAYELELQSFEKSYSDKSLNLKKKK